MNTSDFTLKIYEEFIVFIIRNKKRLVNFYIFYLSLGLNRAPVSNDWGPDLFFSFGYFSFYFMTIFSD